MSDRSRAQNPPSIPTRSGRAPWTLRRRLVVAVVAMLAVVSLSIGTVSVAILSASLMDDLDNQLANEIGRAHV